MTASLVTLLFSELYFILNNVLFIPLSTSHIDRQLFDAHQENMRAQVLKRKRRNTPSRHLASSREMVISTTLLILITVALF